LDTTQGFTLSFAKQVLSGRMELGHQDCERSVGLVQPARDPGSAVAADVLAKLPVDFSGLLDAVVEHRAPFFGIFVEVDGAEEKAGLQDDFEGITEVVREPANLFGLLLGNGFWLNRERHEEELSGMKCRAGRV